MYTFGLDPDAQSSYLSVFQKTIQRLERDGMCIFRAVQVVLKEKGNYKSLEDLVTLLREEVTDGKYKGFTADGVSVKDALASFIEAPNKHYVQPNVDSFLPILLIALKAKGIVYKTDADGNISQLSVGSDIAEPQIKDCFFAQTTIRHLDAVVTKIKPEIDDTKPYPCTYCLRCFEGPKRLERHICSAVLTKKSASVSSVVSTINFNFYFDD